MNAFQSTVWQNAVINSEDMPVFVYLNRRGCLTTSDSDCKFQFSVNLEDGEADKEV